MQCGKKSSLTNGLRRRVGYPNRASARLGTGRMALWRSCRDNPAGLNNRLSALEMSTLYRQRLLGRKAERPKRAESVRTTLMRRNGALRQNIVLTAEDCQRHLTVAGVPRCETSKRRGQVRYSRGVNTAHISVDRGIPAEFLSTSLRIHTAERPLGIMRHSLRARTVCDNDVDCWVPYPSNN